MAARSGYARPARRVPVSVGPFAGMRDRRPASAEGAGEEAAYAAYMENLWVRDPANPSGVELRPAFAKLFAIPGGRTPQGVHFHITTSGALVVLLAAGGKLYRLGPASWDDVTPASPTISSAARFVYFVTFDDAVVVSDGVNKPWIATNLVSGTPVTATAINVDSVPTSWAAFGPPVVRAGKLVFIRDNDRTRIVWSEELDASTGYEQTGYANYWSLTQTDASPLTALAATNDALYFFRERSIGAVYGAIASDFATASTEDAISTGHGTVAPASVRVVGDEVWFLNNNGLPALVERGAGVRVLTDGAESFIGLAPSVTPVDQTSTWTLFSPEHGLVLMAAPTALASTQTMVAVFHLQTRAFQGFWKMPGGVTALAAGVYRASTTNPPTARILVADGSGNTWWSTSNFATAYAGRDYDGSTYTPISATLITEPILGNASTEVRWDLIAAALRIPTDNSSLARSFTIAYRVPRATYGTAQAATATAAYDGGSARAVVGVLAQGRSIQVRIATSATSPGRFVLDAIALEGAALPPNAVAY